MKTANIPGLVALLAAAGFSAGCHETLDPAKLQNDTVNPACKRVTDAHGVTRIYHSDFLTPPGNEWSRNPISKTPVGARPYLGDFAPRDPLTLSLTDLPRHDLVRISFDLYLIGGWSGSSTMFGYSRWDMDTGDGRNLIHTTFCNWGGAYVDNNEQAFPDNFPARPHPGFTLAAEKQTLGIMSKTVQGNSYDASSVYHLVLTFPHTDHDILFAFHSLEQGFKEKFYGFANLTVETLPASAPRTDAEFAWLWKNLGDQDPQTFFTAQWALIAAGNQTVEYITRHVEENIDLSADQINLLLLKIVSPDGSDIENVCDSVARQGYVALTPLREALAAASISSETKKILERVRVAAKKYNESPTQLRLLRARQLLGIIHTKAALALAVTIPEPPPRNLDLR